MQHSVPAATGELSVTRVALLVLVAVALSGCQNALERQEIADDQSCRKIIAERNDAKPYCLQRLPREHAAVSLAARNHRWR